MYGAVNHCFCIFFIKSVMNTPTKENRLSVRIERFLMFGEKCLKVVKNV